MEILSRLVESLVVIVMLAVFLELLLPTSTMQNYVKMVMGLLVVIAVLQVLFDFFHADFNLYVPEISAEPSITLEQIQVNAKELSEEYKDKAVEDYRQGVKKQVMALASLNQEVEVLDAGVELDTSEGKNFGQLQFIQLTVAEKSRGNDSNKVKPVEIKVQTGERSTAHEQDIERQQTVNKLAKTVADFYNLPDDKVKVIYSGK
ncbi:MAG: stage III sporulation protein AF [Desulfotomaculum sp.]|nr:stage III sporulation protein AF [Desulfotomaculum sp.]